ncbi:MAG: type II secretion system F family protein [Microthrixaceae bacterium]|nr:type II secretion system F family protein [Acidimicrobiales bacterium]MCB9404676.1 type II secretion system F family protein [Microthrixaceae bacterium]
MLILALLLLGASVGVVIFVLGSSAEERSTVRASLRQLEGYEVDNVREQELLKPMRERTVAPVVGVLSGIGNRFTPEGYKEKTRLRFMAAGYRDQDTVDRFFALRLVLFAMVPVAWWLIYGVVALTGMTGLAAAVLLSVALVLGPDAIVNRRVEERQMAIRRALPDVLDLLVISVEAGLGFEQALDRTVAAVPGPLTEEFARMLGEVRAGATRANAMRAMERRCDVPELRSFVLAILQADTFGVSIGRVLRAQADEMRIKRRQLAQERAQKAPVKMLIPMVFCVFPALFVVVIGPAVISMSQNL